MYRSGADRDVFVLTQPDRIRPARATCSDELRLAVPATLRLGKAAIDGSVAPPHRSGSALICRADSHKCPAMSETLEGLDRLNKLLSSVLLESKGMTIGELNGYLAVSLNTKPTRH